MTPGTDDDTRLSREVASRAIRRLDVLEWATLGAAVLLAIAGGALVAFVLDEMVAWSFRRLWFILSLLLFIIPGVIVFARLRREEAASRTSSNQGTDETHG
jgi:uncharacterized membrane protein